MPLKASKAQGESSFLKYLTDSTRGKFFAHLALNDKMNLSPVRKGDL